jgi:hypothetical protein
MAFLKRRNRMVIFRVTEDEYENMKAVCSIRGARNLSDFARKQVLHSIEHEPAPPGVEVKGQLHQIDQKLSALEGIIQRMAQLLERK